MNVPIIETERLRLRALSQADFEDCARMMADPRVARYLGDGRTLNRVDAWRQLAVLIGHWELRGFGFWGVEIRETRQFIGRIGCFEPEGWPAFEVGYSLVPEAWGHGYAREGAAASLDFARTVLKKEKAISLIRPANEPSVRVATALGAKYTGDVELFGATSRVYTYE